MKSAFVEADAKAAIDHYAGQGINEDLALRVYTTRLLGRDPKLVLHGGGNTSVKTRVTDLQGEETDVLCVKGSGWDMGVIEPAGLPAVRLENLKKLRAREALSDEDMVKLQRANLIDPMSPNPSVETLLHAFVPHKFVDHTHSTAVLGIVDQSNSRDLCEEIYKGRMGFVRYIMPGFGLAKEAGDVFDRNPKVEGLILDKHGIFTFGATAFEAYERMIEMVTLAENRLKTNRKSVFVTAQLPQSPATLADVAPILRGAASLKDEKVDGAWRRLILDFQ
jgi:rhamnose utilization protein RhaD (predicted bifunctional aldolase and dehydrogenase)